MSKKKIQIGILGYGNLGRGVESALLQQPDMELAGIFTRRNPSEVKTAEKSSAVYHIDQLLNKKFVIDILIICGGSSTDLPELTPKFAQHFNVVDSFDTHAKIPEHFKAVDQAAKKGAKVALIAAGWDPGMFSLNRALAEAILPVGKHYTFWGKGVSQGHSDAIRQITGVADAKQYTIPVEKALDSVRAGEYPELQAREAHTRLCYVVAKEGAEKNRIKQTICSMPNYFAEYDTTVHFITQEAMDQYHAALPHGGAVIRCGKTGLANQNQQVIEYKLTLDSNPEFTASVLVAYGRAVFRLVSAKQIGCHTVFDIPPAYLLNMSHQEMLKSLL